MGSEEELEARLHEETEDLRRENRHLREHLTLLSGLSRRVASSLDLPTVLQEVVGAACELTGARRGVLAIAGHAGGIDQLFTYGITAENREQFGKDSHTLNLLGWLQQLQHPVRLVDPSAHPRFVGFPPDHPLIKSFLGCPIRVGDATSGVLCLTEKQGTEEFSPEDEELLLLFADQAAAAITNAQRFGREQGLRDEVEAARRAIAESEERLQAILDNTTAVIFVKDLEGRYLLVNRRFEALRGLKREELIGKTAHDFLPKEVADALWAHDLKVIEARAPLEWEEQVPRADGVRTYISLRFPLWDSDGRLSGLCGILTDITERKRAEVELAETEKKYRDIVEHAVEGIFQTTPDGHYISANPALASIYGYDSPQEMLQAVTDIEHHLYVEPSRRAEFLRQLEEQGSVSGIEAQVYRKDGAIIWTSRSARAVRDESGAVLYYEGTVEDITERKRAELELQAEYQGLRWLVDASPAGVFVMEASTRRVLLANRETERILGFPHRPEHTWERYERAYVRRHPDGREFAPEEIPLLRALDHGETVRAQEMWLEFPDGRRVRILSSATPIYSDDGRIIAAVAVSQDITPLEEVVPLPGVAGPERAERHIVSLPGAPGVDLTLEFASATERGPARATNEDAVYCEPAASTRAQDKGWLFAVADGMGGHAVGEVASNLAVQTLAEAVYGSASVPDGFREAALKANSEVYRASKQTPGYSGMGTTLTAALITGRTMNIIHVGDTRAYLVRGSTVEQLTQDHSLVAELVRAGALRPEQGVNNPYSNVLTRSLGRSPTTEVDSAQYLLEAQDVVVLCTDGVSKKVTELDLARAVGGQAVQRAADSLTRLAKERGGGDDMSVIIIRIGEELIR